MFTSTLNGIEGTLTIQSALLCTIVSLVLGIFIAVIYMLQGTYTKNFVVTLAILPVLVQLVIMLVNGNVGTSVAVLGTFSLSGSDPFPEVQGRSSASSFQWQWDLQPEWDF
ncbi:MAG: hypothetical protein V8S08_05945 [Lachnoclostridium sp.]